MQERARIAARNLELNDFKRSNGYADLFLRRTNVHKSIRLHGCSGYALLENHAERMQKISEIASEYELKKCKTGNSLGHSIV